MTDRLRRQRRQDAQEQRERRRFVAEAIVLLGRRGLTRAEIARLTDVSFSSLIAWGKRARKITPQVEQRFSALVWETRTWPLAEEPVRRRRLPHPELPRLMAAMEPALARYPVRSAWVNGKRGKPA